MPRRAASAGRAAVPQPGELVDQALDGGDVEEVPGHVQHRAAVAEPRGVLDHAGGQRPAVPVAVEELLQGAAGVEQPSLVRRLGPDPAGRDRQPVGLRRAVPPQPETDGRGTAVQRQPGARPQPPGDDLGRRLKSDVTVQLELAAVQLDANGKRNQ